MAKYDQGGGCACGIHSICECDDRAARLAVEGGDVTRAPKGYNDNERQPLVIIESPLAGDVEANTAYARACLLDSLQRGEAPIASHLLHTQVLDDKKPYQRLLGIEAGLAWYRVADRCIVYGDRGISNGMRAGIGRAVSHGVRVETRFIEKGQSGYREVAA